MDSYKGREKIKSIGQLIAVMAGNGVSDQRCVYDNKCKIWIEKRFEPLAKGGFEWECLDSGTQGETEFVMDSGSQLNILPMSEIRSQGIDIKSLPEIDLNVQGIGGAMRATWYRFRVNIRSKTTGHDNYEEIYLAKECTDRLLSYETLRRLGHLNEEQFLGRESQRRRQRGGGSLTAHSYTSKCEESTIFDRDELKYSCSCPRRSADMGDKERKEEREKNKLVLRSLLEETKRLQDSSTPEGEIKEVLKKRLIDHFKASSSNQCENQKLNLLTDTKMDEIIKGNATPKRTIKPIPCPWNLREKARSALAAGVKLGIIEKLARH